MRILRALTLAEGFGGGGDVHRLWIVFSKTGELDFAIRKLFVNFTIKDKKVVNATLTAPFDILCDINVSICAQERT